MALEPKLSQKLTQQLVMTPQLRQAIKILQVARAELETLIDQEMEQNPVLEETQDDREVAERVSEAEEPHQDGVVADNDNPPAETKVEENGDAAERLDDIDWREYFENYSSDFHGSETREREVPDDDERPGFESTLTKTPDLEDELLTQLGESHLDDAEKAIAELIIGNLDGDGYLMCPLDEIAGVGSVDVGMVEGVLTKVQTFDPPGVAARDLRECLLIQLGRLGQGESLAARIVRDHLDALEAHRFEKLARDLELPVGDVVEASKFIANLEPKPGRNYGDGGNRYVIPDVYVTKVGDEFVITLNDDGLPRLRVSRYYQKLLSGDADSEARGYLLERMRAARWVIESIERRRRTIRLVTESILKFQRDFFEKGIPGLRPLVLRDVANDIGMHESTVSRATSNKYIDTPHGVFELKRFFTTGLRGSTGEDISAERVKQRVKEIVEGESPQDPLSDQAIARLLARENIDIARRTVAKYRELLGILPSSKRKMV